ncbi:MAG TPA: hypothetical protein VFR56_04825 [Actinomycetes bacterium]|nr:hypothetical protein [Actinomycetes bacterium]
MNTSTIIAVVAVVVVLVVAVLALRPLLRRRRLQERFGPEYHRAVETHGDRSKAERDLVERERRYKELDLRPLSPEARERYGTQWTGVQARFVDAPEATVAEADRLVTALMADRGYPTEGYEQQLADLSVEHSTTLEHYRAAHDIQQRSSEGQASTEDLRNAMVHYRTLFVDLLEPDADADHDDRAYSADRDGHDADGDGYDADRTGRERLGADRLDSDRLDSDRLDRDRVDHDGLDRDGDGLDRDRMSREGYDTDRLDADRVDRNGVYADRGDEVLRDTDRRDTADPNAAAELSDAERRRRHPTTR